MTAKELDKMANAMRTQYHEVNSRKDVTDAIFYLYRGLRAIERNDLARKLVELYTEIDGIETDEIVKMGTFN